MIVSKFQFRSILCVQTDVCNKIINEKRRSNFSGGWISVIYRYTINAFLFKGQLILKEIYGLLTSPKKRMDKFVLFAFLLFMAKNQIFCSFFGRIYGATICFSVLSKSGSWFGNLSQGTVQKLCRLKIDNF